MGAIYSHKFINFVLDFLIYHGILNIKLNRESDMHFIRQENDADSARHRLFVCHKISLMDHETEAGYIKLTYIPSEKRFTIFNFLCLIGNWCFHGIDKITDFDETDFSKNTVFYVAQVAGFSWNESNDLSEKYEQCRDTVKPSDFLIENEIVDMLHKKYSQAYLEHIDFFVDIPFVEFISVEEEYRGNSLSMGLYQEAIDWMTEKGLCVRLSNILCCHAVKIIRQKMIQRGMLERKELQFSGQTHICYFMKENVKYTNAA